MNIAVLRPDGNYYFRPDTTLNREAADYYIPDGVGMIRLTPCIYSRVIKAGKCIGHRFAERHLDNFGFGVLLDAVDLEPAEAICMDGTSYISGDTAPLIELENALFTIGVNGNEAFCGNSFNSEMLFDALVTVSARSSVRGSDILAVCLPADIKLARGDYFTISGHKVNIL